MQDLKQKTILGGLERLVLNRQISSFDWAL